MSAYILVLGKRILTELRGLGATLLGVQEQIRSIRDQQEATNQQQQQYTPILRAELHIPESVERDRQTYEKKHYYLQKWLTLGTWLAFSAAAIYAGVAAYQACLTRRAIRNSEESFKQTLCQMKTQTTAQQTTASNSALTLKTIISNFHVEQRPYVVVSRFEMTKNAAGQDTVHIAFGNVGRTPALDLYLDPATTHAWVGDTRLQMTIEGVSHSVIGSGQAQDFYFPWTLNEPYRTQFINSERDLFVRGILRYSDVFGCQHSTTFCHQYRKNWNEFRVCTKEQGPNTLDRNDDCGERKK